MKHKDSNLFEQKGFSTVEVFTRRGSRECLSSFLGWWGAQSDEDARHPQGRLVEAGGGGHARRGGGLLGGVGTDLEGGVGSDELGEDV